MPNAVEEFLRVYAAVSLFRTCVKETEIRGVRVMPGDKVLMSTTLAGRDPSEYAKPNEVSFEHRAKHVSFGHGVHLCLGIHLARREMRIALEEGLKILPPFSVKPGAAIPVNAGPVLQVIELPLVWET